MSEPYSSQHQDQARPPGHLTPLDPIHPPYTDKSLHVKPVLPPTTADYSHQQNSQNENSQPGSGQHCQPNQPGNPQPGYAQPGYGPPGSVQPSYVQPGYGQPRYVQPGYNQLGMQGVHMGALAAQPQREVQWMSRPETIPGCPPGLEYLTKIDQILVHQQVELLEVMTGFHMENKYQIKNSLGQQVYFAKEESDGTGRILYGPSRALSSMSRITLDRKCSDVQGLLIILCK
ncbi:unnamed protein product [Owenia fusiformis]|uniref:Phospholipid scramblase n=1 Tax=Owenia fusiformis TaxID=6347 RepID=A0A8S4N3E1_OWEFU|nr:unnamed protein product [Owenia fusiformis]